MSAFLKEAFFYQGGGEMLLDFIVKFERQNT